MAALSASAKERPVGNGGPEQVLESAERRALRQVDAQLQRLVERVAALANAPRASLAVLDPASQTLALVAAWSDRLSEPRLANLSTHEEVARWVTRHRAPAIIRDFANDPRARALSIFGVGSLLSVPLHVGQRVLGALTISSPSIQAFGPQHLRLLEIVADLGALAILQARQLDAVDRQRTHLSQLLEISRGVGTMTNARAICGLTISALGRLIRCEEAVLFCYEGETRTLCGVAGLGASSRRLSQARIRVNDPQSVSAWVARQRRPLLYASGANGFVGPATEALLAERELSLLSVPLVAYERLCGVITLARTDPFEVGELRTLLTLSQIIAPSLAQARTGGRYARA